MKGSGGVMKFNTLQNGDVKLEMLQNGEVVEPDYERCNLIKHFPCDYIV
jgi:hypothetical protein